MSALLDLTRDKAMKIQIDHRDCGGGGCHGCRWKGTEKVAPVRNAEVTMPADEAAFEEQRQDCPCYQGISINAGVSQCIHAGNCGEESVCCIEDCPIVACEV